MNYLAYTLHAGVADPVDVADERVEGVLRVELQAGLRHVARAGVERLDRLRARRSSRRTSPRSGSTRRRRTRDVSQQALGSLSRAFVDPERRTIYAGLNYPGTVAYIGAIGLDDGRVEQLHDIKQPRIYTVTSLAYDAAHADAVLHRRQHGRARPRGARRRPRASSGRCSRTRASASWCSIAPIDRSGGSARSTASARWCASRSPTPTGTRSTRGRTARWSTTSTCRRTADWLSASVGAISGKQTRARDEDRVAARRRRDAGQAVRLRHRDPVELRVLAGRPLSVRQLVLHRRRRTSSATSWRPASSRR